MASSDQNYLLDVARVAIACHFGGVGLQHDRQTVPSKPVFVTLRQSDGSLRGCIGHLSAQHETLEDEISDCAVSAALRDPRFPALTPDELDQLSFEISILEPSEPISDTSSLDPQIYGVIVTHGSRRGVLLPAIEGVDTVDAQLDITRRKAGIAPYERVDIERFTVTKISADA